MRKKEEFESARLMDFEYRLRARAMRLLAERLGLDGGRYARETALNSDDVLTTAMAEIANRPLDQVRAEHARCIAEARNKLIGERGDPAPYRLG